MPRTTRLDAPGTLHHVIVRGIERRNIVDDNKVIVTGSLRRQITFDGVSVSENVKRS